MDVAWKVGLDLSGCEREVGLLLLQQGLARQAVTQEAEEETYQPTQMAHKDNFEISMGGLNERKHRLLAVYTYLQNGNRAPYSENHAVIKAILREVEDVESEIAKKNNA